jgi:hypothetical protein
MPSEASDYESATSSSNGNTNAVTGIVKKAFGKQTSSLSTTTCTTTAGNEERGTPGKADIPSSEQSFLHYAIKSWANLVGDNIVAHALPSPVDAFKSGGCDIIQRGE